MTMYKSPLRIAVAIVAGMFLASCSGSAANSSLFVFSHIEGDEAEVYTIRPDGNEQTHVADFPIGTRFWLSPMNNRLAALTHDVLEIVDITSSKTIATIEGVGILAEDIPGSEMVVWSPDGNSLAFLHMRHSTQSIGVDVSVFDVITGKTIPITNDDALERAIVWSPDGTKIAFTTPDPDQAFWSIIMINRDGTNRRTIIDMHDSGFQNDPLLLREQRSLCNLSWSPSGKFIAFEDGCAYQLPTNYKEVFLVAQDGEQAKQLTSLKDAVMGISEFSYNLRWSSSDDQLLIAFSKIPWGPSETGQSTESGVITTDLKTLATNMVKGPTGVDGDLESWSPDGYRLAWRLYTVGKLAEVAVTEFSNTQIQLSTSFAQLPEGACHELSWSPDGKFLAYAVQTNNNNCISERGNFIAVISIADGQISRIGEPLGGENQVIGWITI